MSKLSFRARALDPSKPMPIFLAEELPDLPEYSAINRAVPQMPSGMEKEEESEHHLQRAICTGLIIPTPEVFATDKDYYDRCYPPNYKMPRQLIHMQPLGLEQDIPDYDMDSADELWVNQQSRRLDITPLKFEQMMDRLEKSSGQTVVTLNEAKALLKQDDEISIAVYDYWLNKRLKTQHPLILSVKTENRSGSATNNPYLAFRRRTEKMQTRKNRKNDETSYEKMLKLRRDLSRAITLLEMVKRREKTKREQLHLSVEIFEKRYQARDFNGSILAELNSSIKSSRPAFAPIYSNQYSHHSSLSQSGLLTTSTSTSISSSSLQAGVVNTSGHNFSTSQYLNSSGLLSSGVAGIGVSSNKRDFDGSAISGISGNISRKEKRQYKKRKHKLQREKQYAHLQNASPAAMESNIETDEDDLGGILTSNNHLAACPGGGTLSENEDEGLYAFRRNKNCEYQKPHTKQLGNWPWESKEENGLADPKYRFSLTSIRHPRPRCVGFARRRIGRGGRVILDRVATNLDDLWSQWDYTIFNSESTTSNRKNISNSHNSKNNINTRIHLNKLPSSSSSIISSIPSPPLQSTITTPTKLSSIEQENSDNSNENDILIKNYLNQFYNDDNYSSSDDISNENLSRDLNYISASTEPIKCPINNKLWNNNNNNLNNVNNNLKTKKLKILNIYKNSNIFKDNYENSINNISNYLLNKKIKREQNCEDVDNVDSLRIKDGIGVGNGNSITVNKNINNLQLITTTSATATTTTTTPQLAVVNLLVRQDSNNKSYALSNILRNNNRNLNLLNNNNTINDKFNVIKQEIMDDDETTIASASSCAADNLNDILDDENVNLARLSSYINAANKQQQQKGHDFSSPTSSQSFSVLGDLSTLKNMNNNSSPSNRSMSTFDLLKSQSSSSNNLNCQQININNNNNNKLFRSSSLPQDLQQINASNLAANIPLDVSVKKSIDHLNNITEFFDEIHKEWLHFRPKTPPPLEFENLTNETCESTVEFSDTTPLSIEILRLNKEIPPPSSVFLSQQQQNKINCDRNISNLSCISMPANSNSNEDIIIKDDNVSPLFVTNAFTYSDLLPDDQLLTNSSLQAQISSSPTSCREIATSSDSVAANQIDFGNLSGDSLTELNLSLGEDDNEKILDNILQECQIDDIKTLNQTTNFWNGILEDNGNILDVIDEKRPIEHTKFGYTSEFLSANNCKYVKDSKKGILLQNKTLQQVGCSQFSMENQTTDDKFFNKIEPKLENEVSNETMIKIEPPDEILASPPPPSTSSTQYSTVPNSHINTLPVTQFPITTLKLPTSISHLPTTQAVTISSNLQHHLVTPQTNLLQTCLGEPQIVQTNLTPIFSNTTNPPLTTATLQKQHQTIDLQHLRNNANTATLIPTTAIFPSINSNQNNITSIATSGTLSNMTIGQIGNQKFYIKQEPLTTNQIQVPTYNQSHHHQQHSNSAVITLANIKLENDIVSGISTGTNTGGVGNYVTQSSGTTLIADAGGGMSGTITGQQQHQNSLIVTSKTHQGQQQQLGQQPQQHILLQQIGGQNAQTQIINVSSAGGITVTDAQGGTIVFSGASPSKRQINGPTDRNTIQNILKQTKFINNRKFQISQQIQQQYQTIKQEDDSGSSSINQKSTQSLQAQQSIGQTGNFIKMSSYPVVVSDLNVVQQTNSLSAVANHNYSLQPTDDRLVNSRLQPITIIGQQQSGNKIILNTSAGTATGNVTGTSLVPGNAGNFTITTPIQDIQNKINYSQIPTSNIKVNLVTSAGIQQGNLMVSSSGNVPPNNNIDGKNSELLNKSVAVAQQTLHQQQQRIKIEKALNMYIDTDNKKVVYTKLVNLSSLQSQQPQQHKINSNSSGSGTQQTQTTNTVQITPQMLANKAVQNVQRLTNSQAAIVANMRIPIGNQLPVGATAVGAGVVNAAIASGNNVGDVVSSSVTSTGGGNGNHLKQPNTNTSDSTISTTNR